MGKIVFDAGTAEAIIEKNSDEKLILVRHDTSPEDVGGMWAAQGVLTSTGGMTSHAAVVARGGQMLYLWCGELKIDYKKKTLTIGRRVLKEGDWISLNGSSGSVYLGQIPTQVSPVVAGVVDGKASARKIQYTKCMLKYPSGQIIIAKWVYVPMRTHRGFKGSSCLWCTGHWLCRTEHMFFEGERIWAIREFILAEDERARKGALAKLLKHQQKDFEGIFKAMDGLPVTVRLLDPPLHEFVPHTKKINRRWQSV